MSDPFLDVFEARLVWEAGGRLRLMHPEFREQREYCPMHDLRLAGVVKVGRRQGIYLLGKETDHYGTVRDQGLVILLAD